MALALFFRYSLDAMAKFSVLLGALSLVAQTLALVSQGQTKPNTTIALPKANQRGSGIIKLPVTKVKKSLAARSQGDGHLGNHKRGKRQVIDAKTQNFYGALYLIDGELYGGLSWCLVTDIL